MGELGLLLPEVYLAATVIGLVLGESAHHGERVRLVLPTALLGIGGALIQTILMYRHEAALLFGGALSLDAFGLYFKLLFLLLAAISVSAVCLSDEIERSIRAEFCALILAGTVALMLAAGASNLFVAAMALQSAGVVGSLLSGFGRQKPAASEAGIKWLAPIAFSGACLLFAATTLYLRTGTADLAELHHLLLSASPPGKLGILIFATIFMGLAIPMMVFPGNFWAIDVVQGAPSIAGVFLSAGVRAAGFAVASRIWFALFAQPALEPGKWLPLGGWDWTQWLAVSAGLTLAVPALLSIRQKNAKRLLSCVAIVEGGFLLLGLLVLEELGLAAILFSLLVGTVSSLGALYVLSLSTVRLGSAEVSDLRGALRGRPWESVSMVCFSASWLGLPPFASSVARLALLGAAVRREWYALAGLGLFAMTLTAIATGRLLLGLLVTGPAGARADMEGEDDRGRKVFLLALLLPLVLSTFLAEPLLRWASLSLRFIFW